MLLLWLLGLLLLRGQVGPRGLHLLTVGRRHVVGGPQAKTLVLHDVLGTIQFVLLLHVELMLSLLFLLKLNNLLLDYLLGLLLDAHNVANMLMHLMCVLLVQILADETLQVQHLQEPSLAHVHGGQINGALRSHVFVRVVDVVEEL